MAEEVNSNQQLYSFSNVNFAGIQCDTMDCGNMIIDDITVVNLTVDNIIAEQVTSDDVFSTTLEASVITADNVNNLYSVISAAIIDVTAITTLIATTADIDSADITTLTGSDISVTTINAATVTAPTIQSTTAVIAPVIYLGNVASPPTLTVHDGAGSAIAGTAYVESGSSDSSGTLVITTGTACDNLSVIVDVQFSNNAYINGFFVVLTAANAAAANFEGFFPSITAPDIWSLNNRVIPLLDSTEYRINYIVMGS